MALVVEHLPSKCKALSSNPVVPKKKKKILFVIDSTLALRKCRFDSSILVIV
jgi:hypothetical protein